MLRDPQIISNSSGISDYTVAFENLLQSLLEPPKVSVDNYPQNVQASLSSQSLPQNEVLMVDELPSIEIYTAYAYQDKE